jgi:formylglycine-generating enzyme required for sulfatase activity
MGMRARLTVLSTVMLLACLSATAGEVDDKGVGPATSPVTGNLWVLVIGVSGNNQPPQEHCAKDAIRLAETLRTRCGYADHRVYLMADGQKDPRDLPTRHNILLTTRVISRLAGPQDTLLLCLAGSGVCMDDKAYLVPTDAKSAKPEDLVPIAQLQEVLRGSKAARRAMIVDVRAFSGRDGLTDTSMSTSFESALRAGGAGIVTLAAGRADDRSPASTDRDQGSFAYWLIRGLSGQADADKDGKVDAAELHAFVAAQVRAEAFRRSLSVQTPWLSAPAGRTAELARIMEGTLAAQALSCPASQPLVLKEPFPSTLTLDCGSGVQMDLVLISAGAFMMGSPQTEAGRNDDEGPQHRVRIEKPFHMGKYEVTQAQWRAVMAINLSDFRSNPRQPVDTVSWEDCQQFCRRLSARTGLPVRLPTEAEWEYACRANTDTPFSCGDSLSSQRAHFNGIEPYGNAPKGLYLNETIATGSFQPNGFGLYDMHGNVWEWCQDLYGPYAADEQANPAGPETGQWRVLRSGSWYSPASQCRSASRRGYDPAGRNADLGLRVAIGTQ